MTMQLQRNFGLRDDIVAYWSDRASTFDSSPSHGMANDEERQAWADLIGSAIGPAPRSVLELASGTGEVSRVLAELGYSVTGLDFAEPMLDRARTKLAGYPNVQLRLGDAENCMEQDACYDAVISRHLVWTLLSPEETLRDWFRVLKPGGTLVVLDGNWSEPTRLGRLIMPLARLLDRFSSKRSPLSADMMQRHKTILRQLPFADGLTEKRLTTLLKEAGFTSIRRLPRRGVARAQRRAGSLSDALRHFGQHYIYLSATRPNEPPANQ